MARIRELKLKDRNRRKEFKEKLKIQLPKAQLGTIEERENFKKELYK